jgi:hypothetical protein
MACYPRTSLTMDKELAITQKKCERAAEDLKVFYRSLDSLAERLKSAWRFQLCCEPGKSGQALSIDSLNSAFAYQVKVATENFLKRERRGGKAWASIKSFIESTADTKVSYYAVPEFIVTAGRELGIEVQVFSLSTPERSQFIRGERDVGEDMATKLSTARNRRTFLAALENRAADVRRRAQ